jgi:hypothetical protein
MVSESRSRTCTTPASLHAMNARLLSGAMRMPDGPAAVGNEHAFPVDGELHAIGHFRACVHVRITASVEVSMMESAPSPRDGLLKFRPGAYPVVH